MEIKDRFSFSPSWRKHHSRDQGLRHYVEMVSTSTKFPPVLARKSRVMHFEDKSKAFRRVVKKSELKSLEHHTEKNIQQQVLPPEVTVFRENPGRRHKQRKNLETMGERHLRRKPLPTIHFSGDTSKYVYGQHENYNGKVVYLVPPLVRFDTHKFPHVQQLSRIFYTLFSKTIQLIHQIFKHIEWADSG